MWECPDLIKIDNQEFLILSPMGSQRHGNRNVSGYLVKKEKHYALDSFKCIDQLPLLYAPQTFSGLDSNLMIGWLPMPQLNSEDHNWNGCLTLPRKLKLASDGTLLQEPDIPITAFGDILIELEYDELEFDQLKDGMLGEDKNNDLDSVLSQGDCVRISLDLKNDMKDMDTSFDSKSTIKFKASSDLSSYAEVIIDLRRQEFTLDLSKLEKCVHPFGDSTEFTYNFSDVRVNGLIDVNVYIDKSVVEIYALEGRIVMTAFLLTDPDHDRIVPEINGLTVKRYCVQEIKPSGVVLNLEGRKE